MMETIRLYWDHFSTSIWGTLVVGLALPAAGALLFLRREAFLGVAVPQFAGAGLALALWLVPWFPAIEEEFLAHGHPPLGFLLPFAAGAACLALLGYGWLQARGAEGAGGGRLAAGFACATAAQLLFLAQAPSGANQVRVLMRGEVLFLDHHGLAVLVVCAGLSLLFLAAARRPLLAIAFDRDLAAALGWPLRRCEGIYLLLVGITVGAGVMTVGPVLVFGLLFLPPLAALQVTSGLRAYFLHVGVVGLTSVVTAWPASIALDWPYGPTAVAMGTLLLFAYVAAGRVRSARRSSRDAARADKMEGSRESAAPSS